MAVFAIISARSKCFLLLKVRKNQILIQSKVSMAAIETVRRNSFANGGAVSAASIEEQDFDFHPLAAPWISSIASIEISYWTLRGVHHRLSIASLDSALIDRVVGVESLQLGCHVMQLLAFARELLPVVDREMLALLAIQISKAIQTIVSA